MFAAAGAVECSACPPFSSAPPSSSDMANCSCIAGFSGPECAACAANSYKDWSGPGLCSMCPLGTFKAEGPGLCSACLSGSFLNLSALSGSSLSWAAVAGSPFSGSSALGLPGDSPLRVQVFSDAQPASEFLALLRPSMAMPQFTANVNAFAIVVDASGEISGSPLTFPFPFSSTFTLAPFISDKLTLWIESLDLRPGLDDLTVFDCLDFMCLQFVILEIPPGGGLIESQTGLM
eukprot:691474-Rhodomonas_salina.1